MSFGRVSSNSSFPWRPQPIEFSLLFPTLLLFILCTWTRTPEAKKKKADKDIETTSADCYTIRQTTSALRFSLMAGSIFRFRFRRVTEIVCTLLCSVAPKLLRGECFSLSSFIFFGLAFSLSLSPTFSIQIQNYLRWHANEPSYNKGKATECV